jgi:hypothetical protein
MNERILEQVFVGVVVAFATAIINQRFAGDVNYLLVFGVFLSGVIGYGLYRRYGAFPLGKYKVTRVNDGKGLLTGDDSATVKLIDGKLQFTANFEDYAVYGPYLRKPLRAGKYRIIYRLKVNQLPTENRPILDIDVGARTKGWGDKRLIGRSLTTADFAKADEFQEFPLDFHIGSDEHSVEFRVFSKGNGDLITFDNVELARRLL